MPVPRTLPDPEPVEGVIFDLHSTLVDQGRGEEWLTAAWRRAGRPGTPVHHLGEERAGELAEALEVIWETAREVDPESLRDLDPAAHRRVFGELVAAMRLGDHDLVDALYATVTDGWTAYDDALPVLAALRERGVRTALLSNVGIDIREVLDRSGLGAHLDGVVLSYQHGSAKPDAQVFRAALDVLGVPAERALMVGDSWRDDAGAARLGIRTLLLPATRGRHHGLGLVLRVVGA